MSLLAIKLSFVYRQADISRCARVFVDGSERMSQSALANVKRHQNESIEQVSQSMIILY